MIKKMVMISLIFLITIVSAKEKLKYSFSKAPYISPMIIHDLTVSCSDSRDSVLSVDLSSQDHVNKYYGDIKILKKNKQRKQIRDFIYVEYDGVNFGYDYIGKTASNVHILLTTEFTGGSMVSHSILFLVFTEKRILKYNDDRSKLTLTTDGVILKKLGDMGMGDRWKGELKIIGNEIYLGKDTGWFSKKYPTKAKKILIDIKSLYKK